MNQVAMRGEAEVAFSTMSYLSERTIDLIELKG